MHPMKIMQIASGVSAFLKTMNCGDSKIDPADATATVAFTAAGLVDRTGNNSDFIDYTWKLSGVGADFDIKYTTVDSPSGPATNTWHNLASDRTWFVTQTSVGLTASSGTVEIRDAASLVVLAGPFALNLTAEVTT